MSRVACIYCGCVVRQTSPGTLKCEGNNSHGEPACGQWYKLVPTEKRP